MFKLVESPIASISPLSTIRRALACIACSMGTYQPEARQDSCLTCDSGTFNDAVGSFIESDCKPCAAGHYCATPASEVACEAGTFCEEGSVLPTGVGVGYYSVDSAGNPTLDMAVAEMPCGLNEFSTGGNSSCVPCADNQVSTETNSACVPCSAGSYRNGDMEQCQLCPAGRHCARGNITICEAASYCPVGSASPLLCPPGSISEAGAAVCDLCSNGTHALENVCAKCDNKEYYCAGGQELACPNTTGVACFDGEIISAFGAHIDDSGTLIPCKAGEYCENGERSACDAGKYSDVDSAVSCFICPPGTHTQYTGSVGCVPCPFQGVNCLRQDGAPDVEPGFWRFNDSLPILQSTEFYACPACIVDNANGLLGNDAVGTFANDANAAFNTKFGCLEGHDKTVPVCGVCLESFWKKGDVCVACGLSSGSPASDILWICLVSIFVILIGLGYKFRKILKHYGTAGKNQSKHHKVFAARMIVLYQILKSISDVYRLDENGGYPESYAAYIQNPFFGLLSLDIFGSWSCAGFDFYDELLITTLLPTGILCICLLRDRLPKLDSETVETFGYFVATVSLVPISTVVFKVRSRLFPDYFLHCHLTVIL